MRVGGRDMGPKDDLLNKIYPSSMEFFGSNL